MTTILENSSQLKETFSDCIDQAWKIIAPSWPLKNLIAVNPLQGFEDLPIEDALQKGAAYFEQNDLPLPMHSVNLETIKWLNAYFDEGQATIMMPLREQGLFRSWKTLVLHDKHLHKQNKDKISFLETLPDSPKEALDKCLLHLSVKEPDRLAFLKLLLTTLPGWASYIQCKIEWADECEINKLTQITKSDYLAMRAVITYLIWPNAIELIDWNLGALKKTKQIESPLKQIEANEKRYRSNLLKKLFAQAIRPKKLPSAQLVFCIDVRSEPFRRALESTGNYETFGFAGFFGIPVKIKDLTTGQSHASCPVLLSPKHEISNSICRKKLETDRRNYERLSLFKRIYQSIKYAFTTPFAMVEYLGVFSGLWIALRTFSPSFSSKLQTKLVNKVRKPIPFTPSLVGISFREQCMYAENALKMIGLTTNFAPLVVFCGHGSSTENNAYASSLDCGACGGRHGGSNASLLAEILNCNQVRKHLKEQGIVIPDTTLFAGAKHNTTTDDVIFYNSHSHTNFAKLQADLQTAQKRNIHRRSQSLQIKPHTLKTRSSDWAQVRPEWGLARNTAIIIAPRSLTQAVNLEGRCFLHSYDPQNDLDDTILEAILTAPMVVAQWINAQYLFSTLNNVSYGGGSKITKNITGKFGVMQGNASDLMTGLPLQSIYDDDKTPYHELQRLLTIVYGPRSRISRIIERQPTLKKLFKNGWVQLCCIEPESHSTYHLLRDFSWKAT